MTETQENRKKIRDAIENIYRDHAVTSFDIVHKVDEPSRIVYVVRNVRLIGLPKPSADGMTDGQALPMVVAPDNLPCSGMILSVDRQMELNFDILEYRDEQDAKNLVHRCITSEALNTRRVVEETAL